jgi:signal transduction histidine kinase
VSAEQSGSECVFSVRDDGIGIAPEDCSRVFQSFEQVHRGDTRKYGGTGLGLSICKALVEMHGGDIWVESTLGQGSTFSFRIPGVVRASTTPGAPREASTSNSLLGTITPESAALPRAGLGRESAS